MYGLIQRLGLALKKKYSDRKNWRYKLKKLAIF